MYFIIQVNTNPITGYPINQNHQTQKITVLDLTTMSGHKYSLQNKLIKIIKHNIIVPNDHENSK